MENTAFEGDTEKRSMELTDVKVNDDQNMPDHRCQPSVCRAIHAQYLQKTKMANNPWDRLKTVFLLGIIGLLTLWLIVFVTTSWIGLI